VEFIVKGLRLYGQEIREFTPEEFKEAIHNVYKMEVPVISYNYLFPAKHVGELLRLSEKIRKGLLHSALQVECSRLYLAKEPELMTNIILDVNNELFG
jgi:translation elongation factor EF-4